MMGDKPGQQLRLALLRLRAPREHRGPGHCGRAVHGLGPLPPALGALLHGPAFDMVARGTFVAVALAAVLASAGVLPCVCDVAAAPRPAAHCHDDADGWRHRSVLRVRLHVGRAARECCLTRRSRGGRPRRDGRARGARDAVVPFAWSAPRPSADPSPPHSPPDPPDLIPRRSDWPARLTRVRPFVRFEERGSMLPKIVLAALALALAAARLRRPRPASPT